MSIEHWKTSFATFARDAFKANKSDTDDDYRRALKACYTVLSGKTADKSFFVQAWKPDYGAAIITTEVILDPLTLKVYVIGLDEWAYTIDAEGCDNATCEGEPAFLLVGDVPSDKMNVFLSEVNQKLYLAESKKANDRHASNLDGGIQHTPGFLRSKCIQVLCALETLNVTPQCSGFTDVGLHTGCNRRDTSLALVHAVLKVCLKFGMIPELAHAPHCFARFMAEYFLHLAIKQTDNIRAISCTKTELNECMQCLTIVSRYISLLSVDRVWPEMMVTIADNCQVIRKRLEKVSFEQAHQVSKRFSVPIPDATAIEGALSPVFSVKQETVKQNMTVSWSKIYEDSKINLDWLPVKDVHTLTDCKELLEDGRFKKNDAYTFSIVFVSIEMFFLSFAKDYLSVSANSSTEIHPDLLIDVCNKYMEKLRGFIQSGSTRGLMINELKSHQVLISWLKFCLLFKMACDKITLLSCYKVPLNYGDLEHLVLKDKWAWEMLDLICSFLQRNSKNENEVVFSGRANEIEGTLSFADQYVAQYSEYNSWWVEEQKEAQLRIEDRWSDIKRQKEKCNTIREAIEKLKENIYERTSERDLKDKYIDERYYKGNGVFRTRRVTNPDWKTLNNSVLSLQNSLQNEERNLIQEQKAPAYLKQPLPADSYHGKRALFFIHMPSLLCYVWQASFEAQEIIFSDGKPMNPTGNDFHSFYEGPFPYRQKKEATRTPLKLYVAEPPRNYGTENVENIHDKNDGVWYHSGFNPSIVWSSGRNPFDASRFTAVERFSENVTDIGLKWTVVQQGCETSNDRGNVALSKLNQKPLSMSRQQFLSLGNLRAQPFLQLFHLLDSIKTMSLPFDNKSFQTTHTVVRSVLYHIGEIKHISAGGSLVKLLKFGIDPWDQGFMDSYRRVLVDVLDRLKEASKNENEFLVCIEITSFLSQFDFSFVELMDQCSDIALGWAERMEAEILKARNETQGEGIMRTQKKQHLFLLYALVSYEMILPEYVTEKKRINKIIELMLQISSSRPPQLEERATNLLCRAYFLMARILPPFCENEASWNSVLTFAIKRVLPNYIDDKMSWTTFEKSYCWWTKSASGDYLSVNIMNGSVLVNGSPPSALPLSIKTHSLFCRVFGGIDFEVTVDKNGVRKALKPILGRYYSFLLVGDELLIYEEYEHEKLLLLDASTSLAWCKDIPTGMMNLYSHWQCQKKMVVIFRPIHFRQRSVYYILKRDGLYKVPLEDLDFSSSTPIDTILENSVSYDKYLLLDSKTKADISVFRKFEESEYIHPYLTHEKVFKVSLVRYRISFELKNGAKSYECPEFGEYKLRREQQFNDMLYGFHEYLILEKGSEEVTVIFPQGSVTETNGQVSIKRPHSDMIDEISLSARSYNKFIIHPKFKYLKAMDVLSGLQLAAIQAATSSYLPEEGTLMTGYEMAIQQIRRCWINRPLTADEQLMVKSLFTLKDLPSVLVILAQQLVKSSFQVSFLHQTLSRNTNLNIDEFLKAVNEYNLPLQYHLPSRNYRLSLTEEEMHSFLGMHKPTSNFFAVKNQAKFNNFCKNVLISDDYRKKKEEIAKYEAQLHNLTSTLAIEPKAISNQFPLQNLPSFNNKKIGAQMVGGLKSSYEQNIKIPKNQLCTGKENTYQKLENLYVEVKSQEEELYRLLKQKIVDEGHQRASGVSYAIDIYKAANAIPIFTLLDLVQASWQPHILRNFNPMLTENDINELFFMIVDWMQFSVLENRISRIKRNLQYNVIDLAVQELQVQRDYNPYDYPQWLAFEYDQGLQIRQEQAIIIHSILENNGSVAQLNMGLGKTRVIVPCLILEWSRRRHIPRVYFLSNLLDEGFDYLHQTLTGGVFNKKLFRFPFSRDVKLSVNQAKILVGSMKYCQSVGGSIILAPEHCLSLLLKGFELEQDVNTCDITKTIREAENLPFADIFDEVDEMMCPNQELIYAEGSPVALESGPQRWGAIFSLLYHLRYHPDLMEFFDYNKLADFESDTNCRQDEFNKFRLLPGSQLEKHIRPLLLEIANSLFTTKIGHSTQSTLDWMKDITQKKLKRKIIKFITNPSESSNIINESELLHPEYFQDILVLRGLLAYEVLIHCLKLRHDVDYGVVPNHKTLMAIPFRAANLPKMRSEFAQPDCAVAFTVLSYYNIGLTRDQVMETFSTLLSSGPSFQRRVYNEFYELCVESNKDNIESLLCVNTIDKLDLANEVQVDFLYHLYRKNILFINFWLGNVLFPTATMIFPGKMMASSWNLTDSRKSKLRCGFSGTDDACILLPHPLMYQPPDVPSLKATNGKMVGHLIKKATFCSLIAQPGKNVENALADLAFEKDVDALIDAGALLSHHPIETVADLFLSKLVHPQSRFKGVVYYSVSKCSWRVKDMRHRETSLSTSPISESDTFVIYDQSRCRGADMKLRPNAKAFLSIGPCQRKDSLMQAAGRLRQLDFGQTIIAIATPDVEILIKDCVGLEEHEKVTMPHVLCYVLFNSVDAIGNSLKHWSSQGLRFLHFVNDPSHVRGEDKCDLESLYAASDEPRTVLEIVLPKLDSIQSSYSDPCESSTAIMNVIRERTQTLGVDVVTNYVVNFDECERELEQEREMENEKEKELPKMHPFQEEDWDYLKIFTVDSPRKLTDAVRPISVADFAKGFLSKRAIAMCSSINWGDAKIFLTSNFTRPLKENPPYDDYLRPVRLLLYFPKKKEFLVLSEREADKIWRCYLERSFTKQSGGPILCGMNFLLSDRVGNSVLDNMVSSPGDIPAVSHSALTLFNGQTAFCQEDQEALKTSLLLSREAANGASFFCYHRGFRAMFHGSDLEKTCNEVYQNLHALECGYSSEEE